MKALNARGAGENWGRKKVCAYGRKLGLTHRSDREREHHNFLESEEGFPLLSSDIPPRRDALVAHLDLAPLPTLLTSDRKKFGR